MELIINGKPFVIKEKMENIFEKSASLSMHEMCLEFYMKDDTDDSDFDAILFLDSSTGEYEISYMKYLLSAITDVSVDIKRLFLPIMTIPFCDSVKITDAQTILNLKLDANILEPVFIPKDNILYAFFPNINSNSIKSPEINLFKENLPQSIILNNNRLSLNQIERKKYPIETSTNMVKQSEAHQENVFTKKFTITEKRTAINKFLSVSENVDIFFAPTIKSILRLDKETGASKMFEISNILSNPTLGLDSIDDIISLGIFKLTINKPFKYVSCCDIRHAYKNIPDPEKTIVREINWAVDKDILYIVYASPEIVSMNVTYKEYSIKAYSETLNRWRPIEDKFESYGKHIFYIHRNSLSDCIAMCLDNDKSVNFVDLKEFAKQENISYNYNAEISLCFPMDHIYDLNEYNTEDVKLIRIGSMKVINACNIKEIRDDDEISTGYDNINNVCFFCPPRY